MNRSQWSDFVPPLGGLIGAAVLAAVAGFALWQWVSGAAALAVSVPFAVAGGWGDFHLLRRTIRDVRRGERPPTRLAPVARPEPSSAVRRLAAPSIEPESAPLVAGGR